MSKKKSDKPPKPTSVETDFIVLIDSREKTDHRYTFQNLKTNVSDGELDLIVNTFVTGLGVGDYGIMTSNKDVLPIVIERKTKEDLFGSVVKRDNFESRLERMSTCYAYSAVVVESEESDIRSNPPEFSSLNVKSLFRTIMAWRMRYSNVHWLFCINREHAEQMTYRTLERFYLDYRDQKKSLPNRLVDSFKEGLMSRLDGEPVSSCKYDPKGMMFAKWESGWMFADSNIVNKEVKDKIRICNGTCYRYMNK